MEKTVHECIEAARERLTITAKSLAQALAVAEECPDAALEWINGNFQWASKDVLTTTIDPRSLTQEDDRGSGLVRYALYKPIATSYGEVRVYTSLAVNLHEALPLHLAGVPLIDALKQTIPAAEADRARRKAERDERAIQEIAKAKFPPNGPYQVTPS